MGRTENTAGTAQNIVLFDGANGAGDVLKPKFSYKFSRPSISRASLRTGRIVAKQAAVGFGNCLGQPEPLAHMLKFICTTHDLSSLMQFSLLDRSAFLQQIASESAKWFRNKRKLYAFQYILSISNNQNL
jgi:hypothetical protein